MHRTLQRLSAAVVVLGLAVVAGCRPAGSATGQLDGVQIMEDADRRSSAELIPAQSAIFDGETVVLRAARGETVGLTVWHTGEDAPRRTPSAKPRPGRASAPRGLERADHLPVTLDFPSNPTISVAGFAVEWAQVSRPSTTMYGGSRGAASYPDGLLASSAPRSNPAYFDIVVSSDAAAGVSRGELQIGERRIVVELTVAPVRLPALDARLRVWGYYDPRELAWRRGVEIDGDAAFADEQRCAAMFRAHGVLATPELTTEQWARRRALVANARYVPVLLPGEPAELAAAEAFWSEVLAPTDQLAFAVPIDEPRTAARRGEVRARGEQLQAARAARRSKDLAAPRSRLLLAVTDAPDPIYGGAVDIYISPRAVSRFGRAHQDPANPARTADGLPIEHWTYNGNPPYAGSMVVDAGNSDLRTWGWIAWRWDVPLWYVWDALYWHDRHNAKRAGLPRPGRAATATDAVTFDDGEDHGNRDGVLALPGPLADSSAAPADLAAALPGAPADALPDAPADAPADASAAAPPCLPTLRLKALRRGLFDRALLEAASCTPESRRRAADLAADLFPYALADAFVGTWKRPIPPARWAEARGQLLDLAAACAPYR